MTGRSRAAMIAAILAISVAPSADAPSAAMSAATPGDPSGLLSQAVKARHYEGHGDYARALTVWRSLRLDAPADADLELALAIDEARTGQLDSAATRLSGPLLSAAALDTLPVTRYRTYPLRRETVFVNGAFDGWHWYVWRARAEVAAARGRWADATVAARRCVAARPTNGKEWLMLAVCAGMGGHADEARASARRAVTLDRGLPEAHYLDALWAWRDGRRAEAREGFRAAVALDSTFRPASAALLRSGLPGATPDALPSEVLTGARQVGMLTSKLAPKVEDDVSLDQAPSVAAATHPALPDSFKAMLADKRIPVALYIAADGRLALADVAWYPTQDIPTPVVSELMAVLPTWRFNPARVRGEARDAWAEFTYVFPR